MHRFSELFTFNVKGLDIPRALFVLCFALLETLVMYRLNKTQYLLSMLFGTLFVGLSDPGGYFLNRAAEMVRVGALGAVLTVLGFAAATMSWPVVATVTGIVTLLCGLAIKFGTHGFVAVLLLNIWFIITLALSNGYHTAGTASSSWAQGLAWLVGTVIWILFASAVWIVRGRGKRPAPIAELPDDTTHQVLTKQLVLFAALRAVAVAGTTAIAFGFNLPHADWMPVAAIVAMKANLKQSSLVAAQRLLGALLGAGIASIALVLLRNKLVLVLLVAMLLAVAAAIRFANYTLYCAGIAAAVLIAVDLPHPTDLKTEGERVLFTFIGVGIGWGVMWVADRLSEPKPRAPSQKPIATAA